MNKTEIPMGLVGKDVFWNCCLSLYCNTCTNNIIILMLGIQYLCFHPSCHLSDLLSLFIPFSNILRLHGNPGDYAWGTEGLDSIITQVCGCIALAIFQSKYQAFKGMLVSSNKLPRFYATGSITHDILAITCTCKVIV